MIRITAELIPGGVGTPRPIGCIEIANVSNLAEVSDYRFRLTTFGSELIGRTDETHIGEIRKHERRQGIWALVLKVLQKNKDWL